jgi:hypothetical protein
LDENPFANDLTKRLVFENEHHFEMNLKFDPYLYDPFIDDDLNDPLMAALFPELMGRHCFFDDHSRHGSDAQEEKYCSQIVQKLRELTNTLVDEMRVSRKEFDEKNREREERGEREREPPKRLPEESKNCSHKLVKHCSKSCPKF